MLWRLKSGSGYIGFICSRLWCFVIQVEIGTTWVIERCVETYRTHHLYGSAWLTVGEEFTVWSYLSSCGWKGNRMETKMILVLKAFVMIDVDRAKKQLLIHFIRLKRLSVWVQRVFHRYSPCPVSGVVTGPFLMTPNANIAISSGPLDAVVVDVGWDTKVPGSIFPARRPQNLVQGRTLTPSPEWCNPSPCVGAHWRQRTLKRVRC